MPNNDYAIDIAFDLAETQMPDGYHRLMKWGLAYDTTGAGNWQNIPASNRHNGDYGFGTVSLTGETVGLAQGDAVTLSVFCSQEGGTTAGTLGSISWVRYQFRPAHDVAPGAPNLKTSPFNPNDTNQMVEGINLSAVSNPGSGYSAGLNASFDSAFDSIESHINPGHQFFNLVNIPPGSDNINYEFTAFLRAVDGAGNALFFKTDPELITGRRGG